MPGRNTLPPHATSLPNQGQERICAVSLHMLKHEVYSLSDKLGLRDTQPAGKRFQSAILLLR